MIPNNQPNLSETEQYQSVNQAQIDAARAAGNVWNFNGREMEMYLANGYAQVGTELIDRRTQDETGAILIHIFEWKDNRAFVERESAFVTKMSRVGRRTKQRIQTSHEASVDAKFYSDLITGGKMILPSENGEHEEIEKSRDEMLEFARLYPESASEAIATWLDSVSFEILDEDKAFDWMFKHIPQIKILWTLGDRLNPDAAGILTFNSPSKETRKNYDEEVQKIESDKKGDVNFAEVSESFPRKLTYGALQLENVEGIAVGSEGTRYTQKLKQDLITLFNPIWFGDAVDLMHESFTFMKGKSKKS